MKTERNLKSKATLQVLFELTICSKIELKHKIQKQNAAPQTLGLLMKYADMYI